MIYKNIESNIVCKRNVEFFEENGTSPIECEIEITVGDWLDFMSEENNIKEYRSILKDLYNRYFIKEDAIEEYIDDCFDDFLDFYLTVHGDEFDEMELYHEPDYDLMADDLKFNNF